MLMTLPVFDLIEATPRSRLVRLELRRQKFSYRAGQAVFLGMHGQELRRPYSIASAPEEAEQRGWLELLIQLGEGGAPAPHLQGLKRGALLDVAGPYGTFVLPDNPSERHFLFIAGGSGIAPLRAMLWHLLLAPPASSSDGNRLHIGVLYSARTPDEFAYADELERLVAERRIRLRRTVTRGSRVGWSGHLGRIGADHLSALLIDPETLCFICGPRSLVEEMPALLHNLGIAPDRIKLEERR